MHSHYRHRQFPKRMSRSSTSGGVEFPFSQPWWPRYCDNSGARLMIYLEAIRHFPWQGTCVMRPGRGRHNDYEWHVIATKLLNEPKFLMSPMLCLLPLPPTWRRLSRSCPLSTLPGRHGMASHLLGPNYITPRLHLPDSLALIHHISQSHCHCLIL